ncbi:hypothetical protein PAHAL_2G424500 [Panicum hallii]|uniref:Uncharacterized protein n=1 Tax=Panicum hallii TaxID=206008 RepID=A0A2S3H3Y6_9POAL|nr:activating signal cointegrator 1 complex subunit 2 homolog [Panicum hallii]PAN14623.1 hypothetical protein PAHAL_2G424500 [Panicum hallii]
MATELDVSKSRRFDIAMSRRTRRPTSLVACFQDQYGPSLAQHRHQELKAFLECQDAGLKALQHYEDAEHLAPCLDEDEERKFPHAPLQYEDGELKIPQAPLQYEDDEQKTPEQYQDEQEKKYQQYSGEEQKKPEHYQGEKEKKPEQHKDEEEKTPEQYQGEVLMTPNQFEDDEDTAAERYQDPEQEAPQQRQEADEKASEQSEYDEEQQKAQQECCNTEQKETEQFQGLKKLGTPLRAVDSVPRFSLQELIQQKQLQTGEAKPASKQAGHGESVLPDHKVSGSGAAAGGTTLAMVIKRPEGGKKSMGMIRRCVKALNQMIKTKHGSKKNLHL